LGLIVNTLSRVFIFKISATVLVWCLPMLLFPSSVLIALGMTPQPNDFMFIRMLGWAYLALCVGYGFGLRASLHGLRALGPIWVGIVSNGGACALMLYFGATGAWAEMSAAVQFILWSSAAATAAITAGLWHWGIQGTDPEA